MIITHNKQSSDFNRSLAGLFSTRIFKIILETGNCEYLYEKVKKYQLTLCLENQWRVKDVFHSAYEYLNQNYRNEYIYKNIIANKILLGKHNINTTTMLSEFKVAGSIVDILLLNGTMTAYEIKTELDSPDKLKKQLLAYKKAFGKIYLVTHYSLADKYQRLLDGSSVGLLCLNDRSQLSTLKEAVTDHTCLDVITMMKCLRKSEYTSILQHYYGFVPSVSNIQYFSSCVALALQMDPSFFHSLMLVQLKKRIPLVKEFLESGSLPRELTHLCLSLNPSNIGYQNLFRFLNQSL